MSDAPRRRVITTRDEPGELDRLLIAAGIEVLHIPLIEIDDAEGPSFDDALRRLDRFDWLVVTSRHGALRVGPAAAAAPRLRLACVGTRTAAELAAAAGRAVDVMPGRQTGGDLVASMPDGDGAQLLLAQADAADDTVSHGLARRGYDVTTVVAYRTRLRRPNRIVRRRLGRCRRHRHAEVGGGDRANHRRGSAPVGATGDARRRRSLRGGIGGRGRAGARHRLISSTPIRVTRTTRCCTQSHTRRRARGRHDAGDTG
jgi:hypothetical protein